MDTSTIKVFSMCVVLELSISECRDLAHNGIDVVLSGGNQVSEGHSNLVFRIPTLGKK